MPRGKPAARGERVEGWNCLFQGARIGRAYCTVRENIGDLEGIEDALTVGEKENMVDRALASIKDLETTISQAKKDCYAVDVDQAREHLENARKFINEGRYLAADNELNEAI